MEKISFYKMAGSGNDFIIVDNRSPQIPVHRMSDLAAHLCRRRHSVGADGMILVEPCDTADFRWRFYNADGSQADMCGNGARCVARFAVETGICPPDMTFETGAGRIRAQVRGRRVTVTMPLPTRLRFDVAIDLEQGPITVSSVHTGVPHVVVVCPDPEHVDVVAQGRLLRFHAAFRPEGTNVNFAKIGLGRPVRIRTYERGVEDETLSCGTGVVATAVVGVLRHGLSSPVVVETRGGEQLMVHIDRDGERLREVRLEGDTRMVYVGTFGEDTCEALALARMQTGAIP